MPSAFARKRRSSPTRGRGAGSPSPRTWLDVERTFVWVQECLSLEDYMCCQPSGMNHHALTASSLAAVLVKATLEARRLSSSSKMNCSGATCRQLCDNGFRIQLGKDHPTAEPSLKWRLHGPSKPLRNLRLRNAGVC